MAQRAKELMEQLETDAVGILDARLTEEEKIQVRSRGIPVLFYSTAGIRDFHKKWYREALFVVLRAVINEPTHELGYKFFTNTHWSHPITGAKEGFYAFLTLNPPEAAGRRRDDVLPR
ncbi:NTPase II [Besnoitia besnoiti]|uniref:NTPase II n=1 Tax=Besnoitia besnoiti TaxID=94643 RepID=A0A2A9M6A1_BESBE|nr:NTPase II [Besnoitia besnoiti]PFH31406.1 NTPase II [Besnoitia besnoiti]